MLGNNSLNIQGLSIKTTPIEHFHLQTHGKKDGISREKKSNRLLEKRAVSKLPHPEF